MITVCGVTIFSNHTMILMSSITTAQSYEAIVSRHGQPTGPVRLPLVDRQLFIDTFNQRYRSTGFSISGKSVPEKAQSHDIAGRN
jgi:hypothetical protein